MAAYEHLYSNVSSTNYKRVSRAIAEVEELLDEEIIKLPLLVEELEIFMENREEDLQRKHKDDIDKARGREYFERPYV